MSLFQRSSSTFRSSHVRHCPFHLSWKINRFLSSYRAIKERTIPLSQPIDGSHSFSPISAVTIPTGTTIFVGIAGANRLESVWGPDAKEWKPERWLRSDSKPSNGINTRLPGIYAGTWAAFPIFCFNHLTECHLGCLFWEAQGRVCEYIFFWLDW